ncbi:MAG: TIGR04282 family arsenosugar biosynthesis glycosyltransferase [Acidobacteria bacterium]|nr:TIGR04282 family arsenosugar biosynthesis glycosyltransferase [Acidobacteriota bacterium]
MTPVIIVMVKAPLPGFAKTRLTPPLTESDAAALSLCFVQDVVTSALTVSPNLIVAFTPADGRSVLEPVLPKNLLWLEQKGAHLGERLDSTTNHAHDLGFSPIIVLGADSPTLPPSLIENALHVLTSGAAEIVLGPTTDGGYYLIGFRNPDSAVLRNVTWSSPLTFEQTVRNIKQLGLRRFTLPLSYDVDTFADLKFLANELRTDPDAQSRAPQTYRWVLDHASLLNKTD